MQAIIILADAVGTPLDVAFTNGGEPFLIQLSSDFYEADFVIATTAFDPDGSTTAGSRSPEQSRRQSTSSNPHARGGARADQSTTSSTHTGSLRGRTDSIPLFLPPSQQEEEGGGGGAGEHANGGEDEFDFGGDEFDMDALDAAEVAATQALSQHQASQREEQQQQQQQPERTQMLVPDTSETRGSASGTGTGPGSRRVTRSTVEGVGDEGEEEEEGGEFDETGPSFPRTQLGPTQPAAGRGGKKVSCDECCELDD